MSEGSGPVRESEDLGDLLPDTLEIRPGADGETPEETRRTSQSVGVCFQKLIELFPGAAYIYSPRNFATWFVSSRIEDLVGYTPAEVYRDEGIWRRIVGDEQAGPIRQQVGESLARSGTYAIEYQVRHRSGQQIWVRDEGRMHVQDGKPVAVLGFLTDITAQKKVEELLLQSEKTRTLGLLASGMAHDFGNILTVIRGFAALALSYLPADEPAGKAVQQVSQSAERATSLTRRLMVLARKGLTAPIPVDVNEVILELTDFLSRLVGEEIRIVARLFPEPCIVQIDPSEVWQIVINAALNGKDAMPLGGTLTLETSALSDGGGIGARPFVQLSVSDTGVGMSPETLSKAFEPLFSTKDPDAGTGLGLATIRSIAQARGGRAEISSAISEGTVLSVFLPRLAEAVEAHATSYRTAGPWTPTETVLVVEDEVAVRSVITSILKVKGYHVLEAGTAEEALRMAELYEAEIQLLVSDVVLPRMSGPALARQLAVTRPECRVLLVSAYPPDALQSYGIPASWPLLQKPFPLDELLATVREVLDRPPADL